MTNENAHLYLPFVQAMAEGKRIDANRAPEGQEPNWVTLNANASDEVFFVCSPELYRVTP